MFDRSKSARIGRQKEEGRERGKKGKEGETKRYIITGKKRQGKKREKWRKIDEEMDGGREMEGVSSEYKAVE